MCAVFFFFFQAEDGIRDYKVTGVQTCALPIWTPCSRTGALPACDIIPRTRGFPPGSARRSPRPAEIHPWRAESVDYGELPVARHIWRGSFSSRTCHCRSTSLSSCDYSSKCSEERIHAIRYTRSEERRVGKEC